MARKPASKAPIYLDHFCGDCGWGKFYYDFKNLDIEGKPICLRCPYTENRVRIRSEKACDKWKPKMRRNEQNAK